MDRGDFIFNEETFIPFNTRLPKRVAFLGHVRLCISVYKETTQVQRFSLSMARPLEYEDDVYSFIHFAVSRGVKHLELDFYNTRNERAHSLNPNQGFRLPEQVYDHHQNLKSLQLMWCNTDLFRLTNFKNLEILTLGWINITTSQLWDLVVSCPILNTLKLRSCSGLDVLHIFLPNNTRLESLVVDKCHLDRGLFLLDGPKLRRFIYSGKVARFHMGDTCQLVEARLDLRFQFEFVTGPLLCELLEQLRNVRFMTVCSTFLQIITSGNRHYHTEENLNVEHLTMNTDLHDNEFIGIKFMLASCPRMSTLTLCLRPGMIFSNYVAPYEITSTVDFWSNPVIVEPCLRQSLQVFNLHGFRGTYHQMKFIEYIISYSGFLTSVNLYLHEEARRDAYLMTSIRLRVSALNRMANPYSKVSLFNAITYD